LRKNGFKAPIIMLTGHDTDSDTILGLESGADDYIIKPFRFAVLLARIRAQLRQHETSEDAVLTIGPYAFRPGSKLLLNSKGRKVRLTEKESSILRYLYRADQRPVSRKKSGATTRESPRTPSRRTSIDYGKRLSGMPPLRSSCSLKPAATNWCLDRGVMMTSDKRRSARRRCRPPATGSKWRVPIERHHGRLMDYLLVANLITRQKDQWLIGERCSPAQRAASGGSGAALPYSGMKSRASCLSRGSGQGIVPTPV
jgi:hypothetical protein